MRKITFGGANSLDNFFARKDHAVDWLMWSDEAGAVMAGYWKTIDTVLMGRKTYEVAQRQSKGKQSAFPGIQSYVFSRTLASAPGATIVSDEGDSMRIVFRMKESAAGMSATLDMASRVAYSRPDARHAYVISNTPLYSATLPLAVMATGLEGRVTPPISQ